MAEILIHTEEIPEEAVKRLALEGVITVQVKDMKAFKFLQTQPASISCNQFVWALLDGLAKETGSFGDNVRRKILDNLAVLANEWRAEQKAAKQ